MVTSEQSWRGNPEPEVGAAKATVPESTDPTPPTPAQAAAEAGVRDLAGLIIELTSRMDAVSDWASKTQSRIKALQEAQQTLESRLVAAESIHEIVQSLNARVNDLDSDQVVVAVDRAIGYQATPQQQAALFAAMAEWQSQATTVGKGQTASIATRSGQQVSYSYADIGAVSEIARSAGKFGLSHFHREIVISGQAFIRTYLVHSGGGWISCDVPLLVKENSLISSQQQWASACTMARRYGLFLVLGIAAAEEDDDGVGAGVAPRARNTTPPAGATQGASRTSTPTRVAPR